MFCKCVCSKKQRKCFKWQNGFQLFNCACHDVQYVWRWISMLYNRPYIYVCQEHIAKSTRVWIHLVVFTLSISKSISVIARVSVLRWYFYKTLENFKVFAVGFFLGLWNIWCILVKLYQQLSVINSFAEINTLKKSNASEYFSGLLEFQVFLRQWWNRLIFFLILSFF